VRLVVVVVMVLSGCDWILDLHHLETVQEPIAGHWAQVGDLLLGSQRWGDNGFGQLGTGAGWTSTFAQVASP
jgi:hypothetical protein